MLADNETKQWTQLPGLFGWAEALEYVDRHRAPWREIRVSLAQDRKGRRLYSIFVSAQTLEQRCA